MAQKKQKKTETVPIPIRDDIVPFDEVMSWKAEIKSHEIWLTAKLRRYLIMAENHHEAIIIKKMLNLHQVAAPFWDEWDRTLSILANQDDLTKDPWVQAIALIAELPERDYF